MSNQNQHQSTFADISQSLSQTNSKLQKTSPIYFICFVLAIILGIFNGINPSELGNVVANSLSEVFIRLFKFVSVPIIGLAICLTIVKLGSDKSQQQLWKRTLFYTLSTTILAAATAAVRGNNYGKICCQTAEFYAFGKFGYTIQFVIILPLFLLFRKLNPLQVFSQMFKAVAVAFCTKSSAATLPVTLSCAENNLQADKKVANFVLPICTTINMNGCAAFILTTVVYLMQNNGVVISPEILLGWIFIATIAAVGNAGVPMGCFFLSASLLSSMNVPIILLGVILPVYALLDMIETGLNVWSDSCVCAMVDKDLKIS